MKQKVIEIDGKKYIQDGKNFVPYEEESEMPKKSNGKLRKESSKKTTKKYSPKKEEFVSLFVSPAISINGIRYQGNVRVPESMAVDIRYSMQQVSRATSQVGVFVEHPTKDLGSV